MIYRALVVQNDTFLTEGFVWVRLDNTTNGINYDLHKDPENLITNEIKSRRNGSDYADYYRGGCSKAYVCSPFGGGEGYGMFTIPQINSRVIVSNIDNDIYEYVVLGSVFDNKAGKIDLPKDNSINNPNVSENDRKITDINGSLVIAMKHTELADPLNAKDSKDMLDWAKRPVENLLVLNRNGTIIQHNILDSDNSKGNLLLEMDADGASIDYTRGDDHLGRMMVAIDPEDKKPIIELSSMQGSNITQIKGRGKELDIMVTDGSDATDIKLTQNEIVISAPNGNITIKNNGNITVYGTNVTIGATEGGKINLGSGEGGGYLVTYPMPGMALTLGDGDSLNVAKNVTAS